MVGLPARARSAFTRARVVADSAGENVDNSMKLWTAAARQGGSIDQAVVRAQPVLTVAARVLAGLGRVIAGLSVIGGIGAAGVLWVGLVTFGPRGGFFALLALLPLAGWRIGRRAVRASRLLRDPHLVMTAVRASGQAGADWLDHVGASKDAIQTRRPWRAVSPVVNAGDAFLRMISPDIPGGEDLARLALWRRTWAMALAGFFSPLLLLIAIVWGLARLVV